MSTPFYDASAAKRTTSVSVNQDLLDQARALGINISGTLETRLAELVEEARRAAWLEENRDAIASYNDRIEEQGAFSDGHRRF